MENIFLKIFNMSITASWIALAVMLLRLPLKKAPKWVMGVLWAFVALRLMLPISLESVLSLIPSAHTLPADFTYSPAPIINSGIPMINSAVNPVISESLAPAPGASVNPTQVLSFIASSIWIIGAAGMLLYMLISYLVLKLKVRESVSLEKGVRICDRIPSPFVLGVIFPKIYVPSNLSEDDMRYVMEHERTHIKRGDHLWKPLGFLLLSVYWFNPILWAAYVLMCRDIELACDEKVIRSLGEDSKKAYSEALINCSAPRRLVSACPLAFGEVGVKERIKRVLNYKKPAFWIIILAVVSCVVVAVCFLTNPARQNTIASVHENTGAQFFRSPFEVWVKKGAFDNDAINGTGEDVCRINDVWDYVNQVGGIKLGSMIDADPATVGGEPDYLIVVKVLSYYNHGGWSQVFLAFNSDFTEHWTVGSRDGKPEKVFSVQEPEKARKLFSQVILSIEAEIDGDKVVIQKPTTFGLEMFRALESCKFDKSTEIKNFNGFGETEYMINVRNILGDEITIANDGSGAVLTVGGRAFGIGYPDFDAVVKRNCSYEFPPTACVIPGLPENTALAPSTIFGRYYAAYDTVAQSVVLSSIQRPEFAPVFELYNSRYDSKVQNVVPAEGLMLISRDTGELRDLGDAEEITLTKENFDDLFSTAMQWEDGINPEYLRKNAEKTYCFSSDTEFYYIIRTNSGELYALNGSIYREGEKVTNSLWTGYRLTDVTPGPNSLGGYIDHAFFDIDNDGKQETCILSYGPTSGLYTIMFTVRRDDRFDYSTIFCPQFTYLRDPTDLEGGYNLYSNYRFGVKDGRYIITAVEDSPARPEPLELEISIRDGAVVLIAEDGTEMQVWGNGVSPDEKPATMAEVWGSQTRDDIPDMPIDQAGFESIAKSKLTLNADEIFRQYTGGKTQRIPSADYNPPASSGDIVFYKDDGEPLGDVIRAMEDEIMKPLTQPSQERPLTVTEYSIGEQRYIDSETWNERVISSLWDEFSSEGRLTHSAANDFIDARPGWDFLLSEDMWILPHLDIYYSYTGTDLITMQERLDSGDTAVNGLLPLMKQGSDDNFWFAVVRRDGVYLLARADGLCRELERK